MCAPFLITKFGKIFSFLSDEHVRSMQYTVYTALERALAEVAKVYFSEYLRWRTRRMCLDFVIVRIFPALSTS